MKIKSVIAATLSIVSLTLATPQVANANPKSCTMDFNRLNNYAGLNAIPYGRSFKFNSATLSPLFYMPYSSSKLVLVFRITGVIDGYKIKSSDQLTAMFVVNKHNGSAANFAWMCANGDYRVVNKVIDLLQMPLEFQSAVQQSRLATTSSDVLQMFK